MGLHLDQHAFPDITFQILQKLHTPSSDRPTIQTFQFIPAFPSRRYFAKVLHSLCSMQGLREITNKLGSPELLKRVTQLSSHSLKHTFYQHWSQLHRKLNKFLLSQLAKSTTWILHDELNGMTWGFPEDRSGKFRRCNSSVWPP
jgi:hypothetical protein